MLQLWVLMRKADRTLGAVTGQRPGTYPDGLAGGISGRPAFAAALDRRVTRGRIEPVGRESRRRAAAARRGGRA